MSAVTKSNSTDSITVLYCTPGYRATKVHSMTDCSIATQGYNAGMFFTSRSYSVSGIRDLSAALAKIESVPAAFVIRGEAVPTLDQSKPQRRLKVNFITPAQGRQYVMIDIDKLPLPTGKKLTKRILAWAINYVIGKLPPEFQNASVHWQLSSSAGVKDPTKISLHLWFWFDHPITDPELKAWSKHVNAQAGLKLIDTALFHDVQPHYTAAPTFINMPDPFPMRSGLILKERDEVALVLPPPVQQVKKPRAHKKADSRAAMPPSSGSGFAHHLRCIGDHPGGEGFHGPIIRAAASHVATVGRDNLDTEWLYQQISDAVLSADSSQHEPDYVEMMAGREHIMSAIDGAIHKFGDAPASRSRIVTGLVPIARQPSLSASEAQKRMRKLLRRCL